MDARDDEGYGDAVGGSIRLSTVNVNILPAAGLSAFDCDMEICGMEVVHSYVWKACICAVRLLWMMQGSLCCKRSFDRDMKHGH